MHFTLRKGATEGTVVPPGGLHNNWWGCSSRGTEPLPHHRLNLMEICNPISYSLARNWTPL